MDRVVAGEPCWETKHFSDLHIVAAVGHDLNTLIRAIDFVVADGVDPVVCHERPPRYAVAGEWLFHVKHWTRIVRRAAFRFFMRQGVPAVPGNHVDAGPRSNTQNLVSRTEVMSGVGSAHQLQIQQKKTVSQHETECTESRHRYAMRGEHRLRGISEAVRSRPMRGSGRGAG